MGAEAFHASLDAENEVSAFEAAVQQAEYDYGHAGYTGTIAEKGGHLTFAMLPGVNVDEVIDLCEKGSWGDDAPQVREKLGRMMVDPRRVTSLIETYDDKWGAAVCIKDDDGVFHFFGYASC